MGSLQASERSAWWVTGLALGVGIANVFLDWLSGVWVWVLFVVAALGVLTIWQLRRMPEDLRQAINRASEPRRPRRRFFEALAFTGFIVAMAFTPLPVWAILAIIFPFVLVMFVREYVLAKRRLESEGQ